MANVLFKRGLQANLPAQYNDGVFYFTTDTSRLYIDTGSKRHLLNQTIQVKSSVTDLSAMSDAWSAGQKADHAGDFYYVDSGADSVSGNILAYWNGSRWVLINPDTDTTITLIDISTTVNNNTATVVQTFTDSSNNTDLTSNLSITGANGISISSSTNNNVTISGSTYAISTTLTGSNKIATIELNSSNTSLNSSSVNFFAGNNVLFSTTTNGVAISSTNNVLTNASLTSPRPGELSLTLEDSEQNSVTATLANLKVMLSNDYYLPLTTNTSGTAAEVYTKGQVDNLLNGINGMHVVGTIGRTGVGTVTILPTENVHQGDVYLVASSGYNVSAGATFDSNLEAPAAGNVRVGDMIIAQGTETNGVINSSSLTWLYVPSGNDAADGFIYRGAASSADNLLVLKDGNDLAAAGVKFIAGTDMAVSSTTATPEYNGVAGEGEQLITTISHAAITSTTSTTNVSASISFSAIKDITINNGHITGVTYGTYQPNSYTFEDVSITSNTANSVSNVNIDITLQDYVNNETTATVGIQSNTLQLSPGATTGTAQIELVWGEF